MLHCGQLKRGLALALAGGMVLLAMAPDCQVCRCSTFCDFMKELGKQALKNSHAA